VAGGAGRALGRPATQDDQGVSVRPARETHMRPGCERPSPVRSRRVPYDASMDHAAAETIITSLPFLDEQQVTMLQATWNGGDASIRQRAWRHGRHALVAQGQEHTLEVAQEAVGRWLRDQATGLVGRSYQVYAGFSNQTRLDARIGAAPAILDAVLATLLHDVLTEDERDELIGPWLMATGHTSPATDQATLDPARGDTDP
jgi:hypothetical protein